MVSLSNHAPWVVALVLAPWSLVSAAYCAVMAVLVPPLPLSRPRDFGAAGGRIAPVERF